MEYYIYLLSDGSYSDYSVQQLAIHTQNFSKEELENIVEQVKQRYIQKYGVPERYQVLHSKLEDIFLTTLREKGFQIIYPSGEFNLDHGSVLDEYIYADKPWINKDTPPSAFRIGL